MIDIMCDPLIDALMALPHEKLNFAQGALLFRQEDKVRDLYLIRSGNVHLLRHQIDGFTLTLHRAGPDAILAEASLFSNIYHCDALAITATQTVCIPKPAIRAAFARDPALAWNWAAYLARQVQSARSLAEILALRTVAERLDAWIALHGEHPPPKGTWKLLAAQIGVSAEALYRELARRRASGS